MSREKGQEKKIMKGNKKKNVQLGTNPFCLGTSALTILLFGLFSLLGLFGLFWCFFLCVVVQPGHFFPVFNIY